MAPVARYDGHAEWYEEFRPSLPEDEVDALQRLLGPGRGRCLDLGCGTGVAMLELIRLGWTVAGTDVSEEMLSRARAQDAELHRAPGDALPFDDMSFDAAVSIWMHTDVDDFPAILQEAYEGGPAFGPDGLRAKVGATHLPLGLFIQAFLDTGFQIQRFEELGLREYPYIVALRCLR